MEHIEDVIEVFRAIIRDLICISKLFRDLLVLEIRRTMQKFIVFAKTTKCKRNENHIDFPTFPREKVLQEKKKEIEYLQSTREKYNIKGSSL
jgi:hypothetical protein